MDKKTIEGMKAHLVRMDARMQTLTEQCKRLQKERSYLSHQARTFMSMIQNMEQELNEAEYQQSMFSKEQG